VIPGFTGLGPPLDQIVGGEFDVLRITDIGILLFADAAPSLRLISRRCPNADSTSTS
jgi:hypothetical protein